MDSTNDNLTFKDVKRIMDAPTRIYCFCNEGRENWYEGYAIREDGQALARATAGTEAWVPYHLGIGSTAHHADYAAHCPQGFELVWVHDPANHEALGRVYKLNQRQKEAAIA